MQLMPEDADWVATTPDRLNDLSSPSAAQHGRVPTAAERIQGAQVATWACDKQAGRVHHKRLYSGRRIVDGASRALTALMTKAVAGRTVLPTVVRDLLRLRVS